MLLGAGVAAGIIECIGLGMFLLSRKALATDTQTRVLGTAVGWALGQSLLAYALPLLVACWRGEVSDGCIQRCILASLDLARALGLTSLLYALLRKPLRAQWRAAMVPWMMVAFLVAAPPLII